MLIKAPVFSAPQGLLHKTCSTAGRDRGLKSHLPSAPVNLPNRLGVYKPKDVCFGITTDTEKAEIMMKGHVNTNTVLEIAQSTFSGVSRDYKTAVGWVFGTEQAANNPH